MITLKKKFTLRKSEMSKKFRVENNNLDISSIVANSHLRVRRVKDVASAHREERNRKATADTTFRYVQISDVDVHLGRIRTFRTFKGAEAPNNARRIMKYGDVLVSTRRPTRGAVVAVPKEFDGHICTVFFTTLRVRDWEEVDPFFLSILLRTSLGRYQFQSMITETAYPVISDDDVESLTILLPDIDAQRQLVQEYDRSVGAFFAMLNEGYQEVARAQQDAERLVLGDAAEEISPLTFGLRLEQKDDNGPDAREDGGGDQ